MIPGKGNVGLLIFQHNTVDCLPLVKLGGPHFNHCPALLGCRLCEDCARLLARVVQLLLPEEARRRPATVFSGAADAGGAMAPRGGDQGDNGTAASSDDDQGNSGATAPQDGNQGNGPLVVKAPRHGAPRRCDGDLCRDVDGGATASHSAARNIGATASRGATRAGGAAASRRGGAARAVASCNAAFSGRRGGDDGVAVREGAGAGAGASSQAEEAMSVAVKQMIANTSRVLQSAASAIAGDGVARMEDRARRRRRALSWRVMFGSFLDQDFD